MVRIAVCGSAGRMGRRVIALAHEDTEVNIAGAVEKPGNPAIGCDAGEIAGVGRLSVPVVDDLADAIKGADVAIAFISDPEATVQQAAICRASAKPLVLGTTGLSSEQEQAFKDAAQGIAVVKTSNFSVGVTVLLRLVEEAARLLGPRFNCEIVEAHHTQKRDAPSGTAISLAKAVAKTWNWDFEKSVRHGRAGITGERPVHEIGMHSLRAGDIVGQHDVLFGGVGESVELRHRAQSRDTFAMGALRAAKWVVGKPQGLYDMVDVLTLR
ncbi:MAG TPA: 4-hydroxy-tetrahydrodipicolinate reductase [Candidatus Latescibacteria bacterium]|nr:4-hydroxy-tetrahydrodipicolinate reductase [Candidatus Latescibacterota bacterium]